MHRLVIIWFKYFSRTKFVFPSCVPCTFRQIWKSKARRGKPPPLEEGDGQEIGKRRMWECIEVEYNVDLPLASSARYPAPHLQSLPACRRLGAARSSFNYFPRHNTSRVAGVLRKYQSVRAMNRIRIFVSFFDYICRASEMRRPRVYTTTETHVCPGSLSRHRIYLFRGN